MNKLTVSLVAIFALAFPGLIGAQSTPRIDKRQEIQQSRINQGVQSGALTDKEAQKLQRGQEHVQKMENKAVSDGTITNKERTRIEHAQDQRRDLQVELPSLSDSLNMVRRLRQPRQS